MLKTHHGIELTTDNAKVVDLYEKALNHVQRYEGRRWSENQRDVDGAARFLGGSLAIWIGAGDGN